MDYNKKDVINTLYQSTLMAATTIGYSYVVKRFFKISINSPSTANLEEIFKLGGIVFVSNMTLDYLYQQGIIPQDIVKK